MTPRDAASSSSTSSLSTSPAKRLSTTNTSRSPRVSAELVPADIDSTYSLMTDVDASEDSAGGKTAAVVPAPAAATPSSSNGKKPPGKIGNIADTLKNALGEDFLNNFDKKKPAGDTTTGSISSRPLPLTPPLLPSSLTRPRDDSVGELPPEVPQRTDARLELVGFEGGGDGGDGSEPTRASVAAPTYDIPAIVTTSSTAATTMDDYEQPTPLSIPVPGGVGGVGVSGGGNVVKTPSSSPSLHHRNASNHSQSGFGSKGKIGKFFRSKKEPKKKAVEDTSHSVSATLPVKMAAPEAGGGASRASLPEKLSERLLDDKYKFPGRLGYGVRLEGPSGPREEPHHWKAVSLPRAIHVS